MHVHAFVECSFMCMHTCVYCVYVCTVYTCAHVCGVHACTVCTCAYMCSVYMHVHCEQCVLSALCTLCMHCVYMCALCVCVHCVYMHVHCPHMCSVCMARVFCVYVHMCALCTCRYIVHLRAVCTCVHCMCTHAGVCTCVCALVHLGYREGRESEARSPCSPSLGISGAVANGPWVPQGLGANGGRGSRRRHTGQPPFRALPGRVLEGESPWVW